MGRNLQSGASIVWTHTFILIESKDKQRRARTYTIWGQPEDWKLTWIFNHPDDTIHWDGTLTAWSIKDTIEITTPNGLTDAKFVKNIYDEYQDYNKNHKVWFNLLSDTVMIGWGNCSNFASTILYNASKQDATVKKQLDDFDNLWFDWWAGEVLYWSLITIYVFYSKFIYSDQIISCIWEVSFPWYSLRHNSLFNIWSPILIQVSRYWSYLECNIKYFCWIIIYRSYNVFRFTHC